MATNTRDPLILSLLWLAGLSGCSGSTDEGRKPPEICTDGIDNDDDGLIDCDDSAECGGLQCVTQQESDTGTIDLPDLEITISPKSCCDFTFTGPGDCPMVIGTYDATNRSEESVAELDASCDLVGGDPPFSFNAPNCPQCPVPYLDNLHVDPGETVTVEIVFNCQIGQTFTADCNTDLSADDTDPGEVEKDFHPTGTLAE